MGVTLIVQSSDTELDFNQSFTKQFQAIKKNNIFKFKTILFPKNSEKQFLFQYNFGQKIITGMATCHNMRIAHRY